MPVRKQQAPMMPGMDPAAGQPAPAPAPGPGMGPGGDLMSLLGLDTIGPMSAEEGLQGTAEPAPVGPGGLASMSPMPPQPPMGGGGQVSPQAAAAPATAPMAANFFQQSLGRGRNVAQGGRRPPKFGGF